MAQQVAGKEILIVDSATSGLDKKIRHVYDDTCDDYTKGFVSRTKDHGGNGLRYMPRGMERLTCLSKLNTFIVGHEKQSSSNQDIVGIEDGRAPRNLRGHLEIRIAEGHKQTKENGGKGGYLCNTQHLKSISIVWPWSFVWSREEAYDPEDLLQEHLLEDMQPHRNLEKLSIMNYRGMRIPKWARAENLATFLPNLVKIHVENCYQLQEFPWLGKLCYLQSLTICFLHDLEYMEDEISSTCTESSMFFPSLEHLRLFCLPKLKGWWRRSSSSGVGPGASGHRLPSFPRLSRLSITNCPDLTTIPLCPTVETLKLSIFNESLRLMIEEGKDQEEGGGSNGSRNWSSSHDPKMRVLHTDKVRHLKSLPSLAFQCVTEMHLSFDYTVGSQSLAEFEEVFHSCSSSLLSLYIVGGNLRSVSGGLEHLKALESLRLSRLGELRLDETEKEEKGCTDMPWKCLAHCLRSLELSSLDKVAELPKGMRHLTALQSLDISHLPLKGLPEWIGCLSSLQSLKIASCEHFEESLPEALRELTSLQRLEVRTCNQRLHERCKKPDGEDWANIQHIPHIVLSE
ncbi:hypothetical protein Cgig2_001840 [Carnegiea gigantea]|uniref:Uncharacterized protein n=1 Tax=Carnegiea gigantea TaxID=171969 RepID=A0A9Q1JZW1_9CARY|nr:hypothetical protein Cgig2_001840 [Carnegiea gigantea]